MFCLQYIFFHCIIQSQIHLKHTDNVTDSEAQSAAFICILHIKYKTIHVFPFSYLTDIL